MAKKKSADKGPEDAKPEGKDDELSFTQLAMRTDAPVVTAARLIEPTPEKPKKKGPSPNIDMRTAVIWGPLPADPPPKPPAATTVTSYVMSRARPEPKRAPSIGSMQPGDVGKK